jgi:hypothetical protein
VRESTIPCAKIRSDRAAVRELQLQEEPTYLAVKVKHKQVVENHCVDQRVSSHPRQNQSAQQRDPTESRSLHLNLRFLHDGLI